MGSELDNNTIQAPKPTKIFIFLQLVCSAVILVSTLPLAGIIPSPGIESSWLVALNLIFSHNMQLGKDIVFTYGPLGFLFLPSFCDGHHWVITYLCGLSVHLVLVLLLFLMLSKIAGSPLSFVLGSVSLFFIIPFITIDYKLILIAYLLLNVVLTLWSNSQWSRLLVLTASLCLAFASSIKFSAIISSAAIMFPVALILLYRRQLINLAILILSYLSAYVGIWVLAGQRFANLVPYFRNSLEVSAGNAQNSLEFSAGPSHAILDDPTLQLVAAIAGMCFFYLLFGYALLTKKRQIPVFLLPFLGFVFIIFKHSFVRQDIFHVYLWFALMLFLFGWTYLACKQELSKPWRVILLILCSISALFIATQQSDVSQTVSQRLFSNRMTLKMFAQGSAYRQELWSLCKNDLQNQFNLDRSLVDYIGKKRIDIMPWEINLLFAYDMNWSPRPVFQSFIVYTKTLDLLNAAYYKENAPDLLFYDVKPVTLDNRYVVFDEPATFREILLHYEPLFGGVLLKKKTQPVTFQSNLISTAESHIGQFIEIPKTKEYLFAKVSIEYSLLGKVLNFAFRSDPVNVLLATDQGVFGYRFVSPISQNGIFLSSHISNNQDLSNVLNGKFDKTINAFKFISAKPWLYKDKINIEFFEMRPDRTQTK